MSTPKNPAQAALDKAAKELEKAIAFQEKGTLRIIQLAEYLESTALNNLTRQQAQKIIETCGFQDLTGQRIRAVIDNLAATAEQLAGVDMTGVAPAAVEKTAEELNQEQINRLLAGEPVKAVKGSR